MILRLRTRKLTNRRQHTIRIARQHDDITRMSIRYARDPRIRDELDRVGTSSVFSSGNVVVIGVSVLRVVDNVLKDGAEADRVEDFGFLGERRE